MSTETSPRTPSPQSEIEEVHQWIEEFANPETRETGLLELINKRETVPDLAPMLWNSSATKAALLEEILNTYPLIDPETLTDQQSKRVCNVLLLLQCVASHPDTKTEFLKEQIPLSLYPFLNSTATTLPFENLRLTSLGVIYALVKTEEPDVIIFLLTNETMSMCLEIMESGSEPNKILATFIFQTILSDDSGLSHICENFEKFSLVASVLSEMVFQLAREPSASILQQVVLCYLRLSDDFKARAALPYLLPDELHDGTFSECIQDDKLTKDGIKILIKTLELDAVDPTELQQKGLTP